MGCGAQGSRRFSEAETTNPRSPKKDFVGFDGQDVSTSDELQKIVQELEDAKRSRRDSEAQVAKVLAEDAALREELERFEAKTSAEASRSSRLDGRCSALELESRALRDELASSSNARELLEEVEKQLRQELAAKDQQLVQLQSQLQRVSDEASDFQAQRDYALSELKAANQVAEALKSTSTVLDKRRKPRRSRPHNEVTEGQTVTALEISEQGDAIGSGEILGAKIQTPDRQQEPRGPVANTMVFSDPAVSLDVSPVIAPEVPWADTPDVTSSKVFGSFATTGEVVLSIEESPARDAKATEDGRAEPKIFSDPSAKVFQFDFSVFDFLKHEALRTPPDSPLDTGTDSALPARSDAAGGLRLGAVEAASLQLPERGSESQDGNLWSDVRWSTRV